MRAFIPHTVFTKLRFILMAGMAALLVVSCEPDDSDAVPASKARTGEVFIDGFSAGLDFQAFGDSKVTAFQVDTEVTYESSDASMRFDVPNEGDPEGGYAGGIFFDPAGRNLSGYNVLSFWGRASQAATIQELGFGLNDTEKYRTSVTNLSFSTAWTQYFIVLPDASKLTEEQGIFYFVDTPDGGSGYSFWLDDVKFEKLNTVGQLQPLFQNGQDVDTQAFVGQVLSPTGLGLTFSLPNGADQQVNPAPAYFELESSSGAATIEVNEETGVSEIAVVGVGEAEITASIGGVEATGSLSLRVSDFEAAPVPTRDPANVISVFSDAYDNVPVDFYNGFYEPFQTTESADFTVNGDNVLNYINYNFVGIEFNQNVPTIDGSNMTGLHVDIYIPDDFDPASTLRINLRDFGANQAFDGGDDTVIATVLSTATNPALVKGEWISVDFDITGMANRSNLSQIVFDAETNEGPRPSSFFVDNIYFFNDGSGGGGGGTAVEIVPFDFESGVAFTGVFEEGDGVTGQIVPNPDTNGNPSANVYEFNKANGAAWYSGMFHVFDNDIDLSAKQEFSVKIWSPKAGINVRMQLEKEGGGGGPTVFIDQDYSASKSAANQWVTLVYDFSGLINPADSYDKIVLFPDFDDAGQPAGDGSVYYVDDLVQQVSGTGGGGGGGDTPSEAAPAPPARDAADVISIFSNAYTDVSVDTFYAAFSQGGGQSNEQVAGDDVLLYTDLDFAGIETITEAVDLSNMTHFHIDVWSATSFDFIAGVVDFGGDGFDGGNDTRGDTRNTLTAGQWNAIDVTVADLQAAGLTATPTDFSQLILDVVDVLGSVYVDNIYFYNDGTGGGGGGGDTPSEAASAPPTRDAADVISIFSNAYTNVNVDTFYAAFSQGVGQSNEQVAGDDVLLYTDLDFAGIETITETVDVSNMTHFHIDVWSATSFDFIAGVVDFGGDGFDGGNDTRGDTRNTLTAGQWNAIDVTIADLQAAGLTATPTDFSQLILDVVDVLGSVYVDNIYFYNDGTGGSGGERQEVMTFDFESGLVFTGVFEEGDGVTGQIIANPDTNGNPSANVYEFNKVNGAAWYSGMFHIFDTDIDFDTKTTFSIKIWSPKAGINVRFQLEKEGGGGGPTLNVDQTLATANEWVTLTFDFGGAINSADAYDKIVIFPDFDDVGQPAGDGSIYYLDDITQE